MTTRWIAIAIGMLGLACATAQKKAVSPAANSHRNAVTEYETASGKVVCTYETPVGSHIPEKRCVYQEDADLVRRETVDKIIQTPQTQQIHGG